MQNLSSIEKYYTVRVMSDAAIEPTPDITRFNSAMHTPKKQVNTLFGISKSIQDDVLDFLLSNGMAIEQFGMGYKELMGLDLDTYRTIKFRIRDRQSQIDALKKERKGET